ncbi:LOW QUALITY PROTEIN: hypothetical protein ACHAWF_007101, partial [Thalassiosira exigua]
RGGGGGGGGVAVGGPGAKAKATLDATAGAGRAEVPSGVASNATMVAAKVASEVAAKATASADATAPKRARDDGDRRRRARAGTASAAVTPTPAKKPRRDGGPTARTLTSAPSPAPAPAATAPAPPAGIGIAARPSAAVSSAVKKSRGPASLKSQLKSQIAELQRRKKRFLLEKEAEQKRLAREREAQRRRRIEEVERLKKAEERRRKAELREAERRAKEAERRAKEEERRRIAARACLGDLIARAAASELRLGVHYAIGEAMEGIVRRIEGAEAEEGKGRRAGALAGQLRRSAASSRPPQVAPVVMRIHPRLLSCPYSPYVRTHRIHPVEIVLTKRKAEDPFGVALRWECRSALVPRDEVVWNEAGKGAGRARPATAGKAVCGEAGGRSHCGTEVYDESFALVPAGPGTSSAATAGPNPHVGDVRATPASGNDVRAPASGAPRPSGAAGVPEPLAKPRKPRRKRVQYGAAIVTDAARAACAGATRLRPGDVVVEVNGRSVGGRTFAEACRAIQVTSTFCSNVGAIRCVLQVARVADAPRRPPAPAALSPSGPPVVPAGGGASSSFPPMASPAATGAVVAAPTWASTAGPPAAAAAPVAPPPAVAPIPSLATPGPGVLDGEFSDAEWTALVRGLTRVPREALYSGTPLLPTSPARVLDAILERDAADVGSEGGRLGRRTRRALEEKLARESRKVAAEAERRAASYWTLLWDADPFDGRWTDAERSVLRDRPRPPRGCRCGSSDHDYVNHPSCPLYRDVRKFREARCAIVRGGEEETVPRRRSPGETKKPAADAPPSSSRRSVAAKGERERARFDRIAKDRAEAEAVEAEARFVLEMERIQSSEMGRAVVAPRSRCVLVLSAVASIAEGATGEGGRASSAAGREGTPDGGADGSGEDDSDEEDLPLASLVRGDYGSKRTERGGGGRPPTPDRQRGHEGAPDRWGEKKEGWDVLSPFFLAKILRHASLVHGHLFQGKGGYPYGVFLGNVRSFSYFIHLFHGANRTGAFGFCLDVMFKGNPRIPGSLSFENVHLLLDHRRMSRLRDAWCNPERLRLLKPGAPSLDKEAREKLEDEWIVAYLSSDGATGLRQEIDVLIGLSILQQRRDGTLALAPNWPRRVPHMMLDEMVELWGTGADRRNLSCVHETIKSMESQWERMEDGWRLLSDDNGDEVEFDDEEYHMREEIFTENYNNWVSEKSGMGGFGV